MICVGGRALDGLGGEQLTDPNQTANANVFKPGSEPVGDNLHGREGNNPDHQLRSQSDSSVGKDVEL